MRLIWLRRFAIGLIAAASLYASLSNLLSTYSLGSASEDPVAQWEARFTGIKQQLPFVRGVIGYISASDVAGAVYAWQDDEGEFVLTQYAMAPIILTKGIYQDWTVLNLNAEAYRLWTASNDIEFEIVPMGRGIYLLHKQGT